MKLILRDIKIQLQELNLYQKTTRLLELFQENPSFIKFAQEQFDSLRNRDIKDESMLSAGIKIAKIQGLQKPDVPINKWKKFSVDGRDPPEIAQLILYEIKQPKGNVIAISGKSGVGKGTIVQELAQSIENSIIWSNGDLFRALTYLARKYYPKECDAGELQTIPLEKLSSEIQITSKGNVHMILNGRKLNLNEIKITELKNPQVEALVPQIANISQKIVIELANNLFHLNDSQNYIIEGRHQTLDYIYSDFRFELIMEDELLIGKRRAAQKLLAMIDNSPNEMSIKELLQII